MGRRAVHVLIVVAFSAGLGHLAWSALGPTGASETWVGGEVVTLRAPDPSAKNLYLRRTLYLPARPRSAWIQVLGHDQVQLFVNGTALPPQLDPGRPVAIVADLAPHLRSGKNALAIVARQRSVDRPPAVSVEGAYRLDETEHRFGTDGPWRCRTFFQRRSEYWYSADFNDSDWLPARRATAHIVARAPVPPRAITEPNLGSWVAPDDATATAVQVQCDFESPGAAECAWLRLRSTAPYRLAINGTVIDAREDRLGTRLAPRPVQWIYDISPLVHRGLNTIEIALQTNCPPPHVLVDLEVQGASGRRHRIASDGQWQWRPQPDPPRSAPPASGLWLDPPADVVPSTAWRPCLVEAGDLGLPPWDAPRRAADWDMPLTIRCRRMAGEAVLILLLGLATYAVTSLLDRYLLVRAADQRTRSVSPAVLALVPPAAIVTAALLAVYDPRVPAEAVHRSVWVAVAVGAVLIQWAVFAWGLRRRGRPRKRRFAALNGPDRSSGSSTTGATPPALRASAHTQWPWLRRHSVVTGLVAVLLIAGGYLRIRSMAVETLSPDEISVYRATLGFLERGFPSIEVHEDIPIVYAATSELVYCGPALAALVCNDEVLIVRGPSVSWGILTILLLFVVGRRMFGPWVGVTAAAIYAFSPFCIEMCHIGRYYSQLQGFALLTVFWLYRAIEPNGPVNRRAFCLTVACFVCMYLSWEGSALLAPGLAAAVLLHRRDRLRSLLCDPAVWAGVAVVACVVLAQGAHRTLVQTQRLLYGSGSSGVALTPMWAFPGFDPWYYVRTASWSGDALIPLLGVLAAGILAVRHRFRRPARLLLIIFLGGAFLQAIVLPVTAKRYAYDLLPLVVVLSAAAIVAVAGRLAWVAPMRQRRPLGAYARGVGAFVVVVFVVISSSMVVRLTELPIWRGAGSSLNTFRIPEQRAATRFVRERLQPDDVVISNVPHVTDHTLGRSTDYWVQTQLHLQAILDDHRALPLHRLTGTVMVPDVGQLEDLFGRHRRIWFIAFPSFHGTTNSDAGSEFIRRNMNVVYEDYASVVFFRGQHHLPVDLQQKSEASLRKTGKRFLP